MRRLLVMFAMSSTAFLGSCIDDTTTRPCTEDDRCLPGYQCVAKVCEPCVFEECPLTQVTLLSSGGGLACGPDGLCVRFPAGSLSGQTEIEISRTDNPVNFIGATTISKVYAIRPAGLTPQVPVEIVMPVSRRIDEGTTPVLILRALGPRGPWESLETARDGTRASAYSPLLGLFVLARDTEETPTPVRDAGMPPVNMDATVVEAPDSGVVARNPLMGIGEIRNFPGGPFSTLHGLAWDADDNRMLLTESAQSTLITTSQTGARPQEPMLLSATVSQPYGLVADAAGRVLVMERGPARNLTVLGTAGTTPFIADFAGASFNGPADAAFRADGTLYFTDNGSGLGGQAREIPFNGLFRRTPAGVVSAAWEGAVATEPRGVELSDDESVLYMVERSTRSVLAWTVAADGSLSDQRSFVSTAPDPDGLAVDSEGNVYVGTDDGIEVFAPSGMRWGAIPIPMGVSGLAFGGPGLSTMYATNGIALYWFSVTIAGVR